MTLAALTADLQILYVEDDLSTGVAVAGILKKLTENVLSAENGRDGLGMFHRHRPDMVITDIHMPFMNGLAMARAIKEVAPETPVIVTTAHDDRDLLLEAVGIGIDRYVLKPVNTPELTAAVNKSASEIALKREIKRQHEERKKLVVELQAAIASIKTLKGLIPICSCCKKIRDDQGYWQQIESYISSHSDAKFSHGICPRCVEQRYPEFPQKTTNSASLSQDQKG